MAMPHAAASTNKAGALLREGRASEASEMYANVMVALSACEHTALDAKDKSVLRRFVWSVPTANVN